MYDDDNTQTAANQDQIRDDHMTVTPDRLTTIANVVDIVMKAAVTAAISCGAYLVKDTRDTLQALTNHDIEKAGQIQNLEYRDASKEKRLDTIDAKLDRILEAVRR